MLKYRDFEYEGVKFHLNDNIRENEFEGKYQLLFYHEGRGQWQYIGTVRSKKGALSVVKYFCRNHMYPFH